MATQTIQVADKPTLDEVKALLENSGYGLEALHTLISANGSSDGDSSVLDVSKYSKTLYISTSGNSDGTGYSVIGKGVFIPTYVRYYFSTSTFDYAKIARLTVDNVNLISSATEITWLPAIKFEKNLNIVPYYANSSNYSTIGGFVCLE